MSEIKVKIEAESSINKTHKFIKIKASQDNVPFSVLLDALMKYKDQKYLNEAFDQNNVQAFAKVGARYLPLGLIKKLQYEAYKKLKQ